MGMPFSAAQSPRASIVVSQVRRMGLHRMRPTSRSLGSFSRRFALSFWHCSRPSSESSGSGIS